MQRTAKPKLTGIHLKRLEWARTSNLCWFCLDELHKHNNVHHVLPRRYFSDKKEADRNNTIRVCLKHHERWHTKYDKPDMAWGEYATYMQTLDWGFGCFVEE